MAKSGSAEDVYNKLVKGVEKVVKKIILDTQYTLKSPPQEGGTPIDTGNASAQWTASVGSPYITAGLPPSGVVSQSFVSSAQAASAQGTAEILGYKLNGGTPAYLSNNAPYIIELNYDGKSRQAEPYFIERAIAKSVNQSYNIENITVTGSSGL